MRKRRFVNNTILKVKYIYFYTLLFLVVGLSIIGWRSAAGLNFDNHVITELTSLLPRNFKNFLRNSVFVIPTMQREINRKNQFIEETLRDIRKVENRTFDLQEDSLKINTKFSSYIFSKFKTKLLFKSIISPKYPFYKASGYIDKFLDNVIVASADGVFLYFPSKNLNYEEIKVSKIKSNLEQLPLNPKVHLPSMYGLRDILIYDDKLFISYTNELREDCINTSILVANMNLEFLNFKTFFEPKECVEIDNDYGEFDLHRSGGRMAPFKDNKILFSVGEFGYRDHAQDAESIFGKTLAIDLTSSDWEVISMGHRNAYGLYYDDQKDIILSTEFGPFGGDEININLSPDSEKIENFGWPISSYGDHYGNKNQVPGDGETIGNYFRYKKAPLHKSHKVFGFIEPVKYYVSTVPVSEIIYIPKSFNEKFSNDFFIAALGHEISQGHMSIHHVKFDSGYTKIIDEEVIAIGERIRDISFLENVNKVVFFLENSGSIGVLSSAK